MKTSEPTTRDLLPECAQNSMGFMCDALDVWLAETAYRTNVLAAPATLEACEALTDEEMRAFYAEQGLAVYYPDLSYDTRAQMLYEQSRLWHKLGTPAAVEALVKYVFDGADAVLTIDDSSMWSDGTLTASKDLYSFTGTITTGDTLPGNALQRISANIMRFDRNAVQWKCFAFQVEGPGGFVATKCTDGGKYAVDFEEYCVL